MLDDWADASTATFESGELPTGKDDLKQGLSDLM